MYKQIDANKKSSIILILVFIVFFIFLGYVVGKLMGDGQYPYVGVGAAVVFAIIYVSISFFSGDKIALLSTGAKEIKKTDNPYVYRMVENLCITAGLPVPKVYIIEDLAINAFATGRSPEKASIAITRGALEKLENEELEGVLAHELSHIKNYDIRFMMLVAVLVGSISILADVFVRMRFFGGRGRGGGKGSGNQIVLIVGLVLLILSPIIAELIKLAISRKREYLADASGALLTRYPEGLARALEKISQQSQPMKRSSPATAHLFISSPFRKKSFNNWFATHPPVQKRVEQLRLMA